MYLGENVASALVHSLIPLGQKQLHLGSLDLSHKVRVMFFNRQASDKIVQHLVDLAHASKVPVVAVTETMPLGLTFQQWMLNEIDDTGKALAAPPRYC